MKIVILFETGEGQTRKISDFIGNHGETFAVFPGLSGDYRCVQWEQTGLVGNVINNGQNGMLIDNEDEWEPTLTQLLENEHLRKQIGKQGRETIIRDFSSQANTSAFLSLFQP